MNVLARWLIRLFALPLVQYLAGRLASLIRLKRLEAENRELRENQEMADTKEERDEAARGLLKRLDD